MLQAIYDEARGGHWANPHPAFCACRNGWYLSDLDTWHRCEWHCCGAEHPEHDYEDLSDEDLALVEAARLEVAERRIAVEDRRHETEVGRVVVAAVCVWARHAALDWTNRDALAAAERWFRMMHAALSYVTDELEPALSHGVDTPLAHDLRAADIPLRAAYDLQNTAFYAACDCHGAAAYIPYDR